MKNFVFHDQEFSEEQERSMDCDDSDFNLPLQEYFYKLEDLHVYPKGLDGIFGAVEESEEVNFHPKKIALLWGTSSLEYVVNNSQRVLRLAYSGSFSLEHSRPLDPNVSNASIMSEVDDATLIPFFDLFPILESADSRVLCSSLRYLEGMDPPFAREMLLLGMNRALTRDPKRSRGPIPLEMNEALSRALDAGWIDANNLTVNSSSRNSAQNSPSSSLVHDNSNATGSLHKIMNGSHTTENIMEVLVVPTPLSMPARHRIAEVINTGHLKIKTIRSSSAALSSSFLMTEQAQNILQHNSGYMKFLLLELGEEYLCASIVEVDAIIANLAPAVAVEVDPFAETSANNSSDISVSPFVSPITDGVKNPSKQRRSSTKTLEGDLDEEEQMPSIFPVSSLSIRLEASEGGMQFGFRELDEQLIQDWLSVLCHLTFFNGNKPISEVVNTVDGYRKWIKLPRKNRMLAILALFTYRKSRGNLCSIFEPEVDSMWMTQGGSDFYSKLLEESNEGQRFVLLHEYLSLQCDPILQVLTQWVSKQSYDILKQLIEHYGEETIEINAYAVDGKKLKKFYVAPITPQSNKRLAHVQDEELHSESCSTNHTFSVNDYCRKSWRSMVIDAIKVVPSQFIHFIADPSEMTYFILFSYSVN